MEQANSAAQPHTTGTAIQDNAAATPERDDIVCFDSPCSIDLSLPTGVPPPMPTGNGSRRHRNGCSPPRRGGEATPCSLAASGIHQDIRSLLPDLRDGTTAESDGGGGGAGGASVPGESRPYRASALSIASTSRNPLLARFGSATLTASTMSAMRASATLAAQANDVILRSLRLCGDDTVIERLQRRAVRPAHSPRSMPSAPRTPPGTAGGGGGGRQPRADAYAGKSTSPSPRSRRASTSTTVTGSGVSHANTATTQTTAALATELADALARTALPTADQAALDRVVEAFQPFVSVALAAAAAGADAAATSWATSSSAPPPLLSLSKLDPTAGLGMSESTLAASVRSLHRDPAQLTATAAVAEHEDACEDGFTVNQYLLLDKIGAGKQGEVFLAEDTTTGAARAVKVVRRPPAARARGGALAAARSRQAQQLEREVAVMRQCRHRNVVALHEVIDDPKHDTMYLVMQYVDAGPIATIGPDGTCSATLGVVELTHFARQLCAGLQYLHGHGVIHRDIKPDNILRGRDGTVYLSDFGVSELFDTAGSTPSSSNNTDSDMERSTVHGTRGTVAFMAPELFSATETQGTPGEAVDVWALGVTFYALLYGRLPFVVDGSSSMASLVASIRAFHLDPRLPHNDEGTGAELAFAATLRPPSAPPPALASHRPSALMSHVGDGDGDDEATPALSMALLSAPPTAGVESADRRSSTDTARPMASSPSSSSTADDDLVPTTAGCTAGTAAEAVRERSSDDDHDSAGSSLRQDELHAEWRQLLHEMLCADPVRRIQTGQLRRRVRAMSERLSGVLNGSAWPTSLGSTSMQSPAFTPAGKQQQPHIHHDLENGGTGSAAPPVGRPEADSPLASASAAHAAISERWPVAGRPDAATAATTAQ